MFTKSLTAVPHSNFMLRSKLGIQLTKQHLNCLHNICFEEYMYDLAREVFFGSLGGLYHPNAKKCSLGQTSSLSTFFFFQCTQKMTAYRLLCAGAKNVEARAKPALNFLVLHILCRTLKAKKLHNSSVWQTINRIRNLSIKVITCQRRAFEAVS